MTVIEETKLKAEFQCRQRKRKREKGEKTEVEMQANRKNRDGEISIRETGLLSISADAAIC